MHTRNWRPRICVKEFSRRTFLDTKSWHPTSQSPLGMGLSSLSYLFEFELDSNYTRDEVNLERRCKIMRGAFHTWANNLSINFQCQKEREKKVGVPWIWSYLQARHGGSTCPQLQGAMWLDTPLDVDPIPVRVLVGHDAVCQWHCFGRSAEGHECAFSWENVNPRRVIRHFVSYPKRMITWLMGPCHLSCISWPVNVAIILPSMNRASGKQGFAKSLRRSNDRRDATASMEILQCWFRGVPFIIWRVLCKIDTIMIRKCW